MQKKYVAWLAVVTLVLFATQAFAEYNKDAVVKTMQGNMANLGAIKDAAGKGDFFTAADKLMEVAKAFKSLDAVTPVKGVKADWDRIHGALIKAAFKGIGACGEGDAAKVNAALGEIVGLMKEGHQLFK